MASPRVEVGEGLLAQAFAAFGRCGRARRECVAYWTGPVGDPDRVDACLHPLHSASASHYEIDPRWLNETWRCLATERRQIRVQLHTHGHAAFHSNTDDLNPVVGTAGFLSLVIPGFASGEVGLEGAYLTELGADGRWHERDPEKVLVMS